ncbi:dihydrofolate reductase-like domain-containing protein [Pelagophyceae sp. CCMP2097]|nr:dihydrofolate reductase-like domain-containing protein [Pelagophyceae sp. CCMP2097]
MMAESEAGDGAATRTIEALAVAVRARVAQSHADAEKIMPFVVVSYASSLDGSIAFAPPSTERLLLSGAASMRLTHAIRAATDAVCVGVGTVLFDDPRLNVRLRLRSDETTLQPLAVVFDSCLRTPLGRKRHEMQKAKRGDSLC